MTRTITWAQRITVPLLARGVHANVFTSNWWSPACASPSGC
jgi:hypothetical protein